MLTSSLCASLQDELFASLTPPPFSHHSRPDRQIKKIAIATVDNPCKLFGTVLAACKKREVCHSG